MILAFLTEVWLLIDLLMAWQCCKKKDTCGTIFWCTFALLMARF